MGPVCRRPFTSRGCPRVIRLKCSAQEGFANGFGVLKAAAFSLAASTTLGAFGSPAYADVAQLPSQQYANTVNNYMLSIPATWEKVDKAGADVLFENPSKRSTSVGITVNPVRVKQIQDFGPLDLVGERLLEAEKKKESTISAEMLMQSQRTGSSGALLYDYEYELDSTRGRKRILNTVTIFNSKLYILNANLKCEKTGCGTEAEEDEQLLKSISSSFDVVAQ